MSHNGYQRFTRMILSVMSDAMSHELDKHSKELGEAIWNDLFDLDGPRVVGEPVSQEHLFLGRVFSGYLEIANSYNTIQDIEVYVGSFPYRSSRLNRPRTLRYHVENYYNENYILKERLRSYSKKTVREYRGDSRYVNIKKQVEPVVRKIIKAFKPFVDCRSRHVHEYRYTDSRLDRLDTFELLLSEGADSQLRTLESYYNRFKYRQIRNEFKKEFRDNNKALETILDAYFAALAAVYFDEAGPVMRYPQVLRGT